jgi:2,4-dienoyl-CoA reductase-like NADH-dependent reductase (Old Yellow Enzyme family)/thioredoxin reductase
MIMAYQHLLSPLKLRGLELRNRVAFPAMATHFATADGEVTQQLIDYHVARAKGGNGLNILEATSVHTPSATKTFPRLCEDQYIPGMKMLTDGIRAAGGKSCVQLWQGGLVATSLDPNCVAVVPSDFPISAEFVMRAASKDLIGEVVSAFGRAARRAAEAGFDTVEFHAAHNYSPHMFLSPFFNKRTDEYGGSPENRARYLLECINAIRDNIPEDMPLLMRIDAHDDYLEGGLTIDDVIAFINMAKTAGVDAVDISRGNVITPAVIYEVPPIDIPRGYNVANAGKIRAGTGLITIAVGRINDPEQAEDIIASGQADMVVMGRSQIADPEFVNKTADGRTDEIVKCIGCNQGCYDRYFDLNAYPHISCLRNPAVGFEGSFVLEKADTPKNVLVLGGGMAGMEAAITLQKRGHRAILAEESDRLGGQFVMAGAAPRKREMADAAIARGKQALKAGVDVRLNTRADTALLDSIAPDAIIAAVGAKPIELKAPGMDLPNVYDTVDILTGKATPTGNAVVIGGGLVGLEVAEYLADKGSGVTIVEMLDEIGKDIGHGRKASIFEAIEKAGIQSTVNARCVAVEKDAVVVDIDGLESRIPADYVVVAVGSAPNDSAWITDYCKKKAIPCHIIGDAVKARRAIDAVHEAVRAAAAL